MRLLYSLSIYAYGFLVKTAAYFGNPKAKLWVQGRKNWRKQLRNLPTSINGCIWFHAASQGEFEQAKPLIEKIKAENPEQQILLTFYSPSGYEANVNYQFADYIFYLPLDTVRNASDFIQLLQPKFAVFIKYEFWFNYLKELENASISTFLVSGIFRKKQHFFKSYGHWFRKNLSAFTHFFVQNIESSELLSTIGYKNITITGDTRFDRVIELSRQNFSDPKLNFLDSQKPVIIFGSSWEKEHDFALQVSKDFPELTVVIAPHELSPSKIQELKAKFGASACLHSEITPGHSSKILIVDRMGILSKLYRFADFAFIGGGFGSGIHNLPEAAVYGCPVFFGPNFSKFKEATELIEANAGFSVTNYSEFKNQLNTFLQEPSKLIDASKAAKSYIEKNSGATELTYQTFKSYF